MTATSEHQIIMHLSSAEDSSWTDCYGECPVGPPEIKVWPEDGRLRVLPPSISRGQAPATIGHLFLASIPFEVERSGQDIELLTSPDRLDDVVKVLHEAGADLRVAFDRRVEADELASRLGVSWRQR